MIKIDFARAVELYKGGATYEEIAEEFGRKKSAIASWFYRNRDRIPMRSRKWSARDIETARSMFSAGCKNEDVAQVLSVLRKEKITNYDVNVLVMCAANRDKVTSAEWRKKYKKK